MKIWMLIKCLFVFLLPQLVFSATADTLLSLNEAVGIALAENPQLEAVKFRAEAAKTKIARSGSLTDLQLSFGILNLPVDTYRFDQEPMTQKSVGLSQTFPFLGKRGLREKMVTEESQILIQKVQLARLELIKKVKYTYYNLAFLQQSIQIVNKNRTILRDLVEISRTRYTVGKGIQQDILKGQVQLLQEEQRLIELQEEYDNMKAEMNVLLNRMPQEPIQIADQPAFTPKNLELSILQESAVQNNPLLQVHRNDINKNETALSLARREYWPDFTLSVSYGQREALPDFLGAMVSMNVPLYSGSKQSQHVEESYLNLQNSRYLLENQKNTLHKEVKNLLDELNKNKKLIKLYEDEILPHAQQALNSSRAAYQNDQVEFLAVIDNQVTLLDYELKLEHLKMSYRQNIADLEMICGGNLD
jgi:cobalt-zinc-cadmium efflux system outer membrane protein